MRKQILAAVLISFVIGFSVAYWVYASPASTFYISGGVYPHGLWTIEKDGSNYVAKSPYGLTPSYSGTTNFTHIFQQVINTVKTDGGRIFLKAVSNWYSITSKIFIPANTNGLEIYGEGFSTRLLLAPNVNTSMFDIGENCTRITFRDLRLSGDKTNNINSHCFILKSNVNHCLFRDLYITEFADRIFSGAGSGYSGLRLERIFASRAGTNIIYLNNAHSTTTISECVLGNPVALGEDYLPSAVIFLEGGSRVIIENTGVFGGRYGIRAHNTKSLQLVNVFPHVNEQYGIWIEDSYGALITNCVAYSNGQNASYTDSSGFYLLNSTYNTINGVQALNNLGWFSAPYTDNSQRWGIREFGSAVDYNSITDSTARGNISIDIFKNGSNTEVHSCWNGTTWIT